MQKRKFNILFKASNRIKYAPTIKKIRCIETNKEYQSLIIASEKTGISKQYISMSCTKGIKAKGFTFEYIFNTNTQ